jgi:hypothetical protein
VLGIKIYVKVSGGKGQEFYLQQLRRVMFEDLILIFIEGYMEFCIAGYLQYGNRMVDTDIYGEKISILLGNFSIAVAIVFIPIGFVFMLTRS